MKKISIIVPVYNTSKDLDKCLNSLVNQSLKEIEIIVINDGSTDNSKEIIDNYKEKYPEKIKCFHRENHGISETRNFGIKYATSEYITFIDSDDYIDTSAYETAYNFAKKNNLDIVVWDFYKEYENKQKKVYFKIVDFDICNIEENPNLLYQINYSPWNKLFKKEIFYYHKFPKIKYEDFAILPKILCDVNKIGKINKAFNYYLIRQNSETTIIDEKVFDIIKILNDHYKFFQKKGYIDNFYQEFEYYFIYRFTMYIIQQRYQKNRKLANEFIDIGYEFLDKKFPNWRNNKYYKKNLLKLIIEKNKGLAKLYCDIYRIIY